MGFDDAVSSGFSKYVVFSGRARRAEYWWWTLFAILGNVAASIIDMAAGTFDPVSQIGILGGIFGLAILLPGVAVTVRRLHDADWSGWWLLIVFVPLIGLLVLIVFMCLRGTPGANRFGPDPILPTPSDTGLRNA